jgi:hypothetical protein
MATWIVSPKYKKSVEEHELWYNPETDQQIRIISLYRGAEFRVETTDDNPPQGLENNSSVNMYDYISENVVEPPEMLSMWDGCSLEWEADDNIEQDEVDELAEKADEDGLSYSEYLEENGWRSMECEAWLMDELEIVKEEN